MKENNMVGPDHYKNFDNMVSAVQQLLETFRQHHRGIGIGLACCAWYFITTTYPRPSKDAIDNYCAHIELRFPFVAKWFMQIAAGSELHAGYASIGGLIAIQGIHSQYEILRLLNTIDKTPHMLIPDMASVLRVLSHASCVYEDLCDLFPELKPMTFDEAQAQIRRSCQTVLVDDSDEPFPNVIHLDKL